MVKQPAFSLHHQDDCKSIENTKYIITKQVQNTEPTQTMGAAINSESTARHFFFFFYFCLFLGHWLKPAVLILFHPSLMLKKPGPEVIQLFSCSTKVSTIMQLLIKIKYRQMNNFQICFAVSLSDVVFIMLIKVKMPTTVGILTFMSRINFVLS